MRALASTGLIALAFGLGATYATNSFGWFSTANLIAGGVALAGATVFGLRNLRGAGAPAFRSTLARGFGRVALALLAAVALERAAAWLHIQLDWTLERKFELSEAVLGALHEQCPAVIIDASLYYDKTDPRVRSSRMLLSRMARTGCLHFDLRHLDEHPNEIDRYGISSSNSIVLRTHEKGRPERWQLVERPTEGTLYEALYRLRRQHSGLLWVARGDGEGDVQKTSGAGYSGLAAAFATEGFKVHEFVGPYVEQIPDNVGVVVWIDPKRQLRSETLAVLQDYLLRGGRLVAFLEPGRETGLEALLARWGIESPDKVVIDPASGPVQEDAPGVDPLVYNYASHHPAARGLDSGRMTFFRGARAFHLHKPQIEDDLEGVAFTSPRAWLEPDLRVLYRRATPHRPASAATNFWPLLATGRYQRGKHEVRIAAFGDSDLASNRYLRTLYNLDLVLNTVHWVADQEPAITLRPKSVISHRMQFPLPIQNTLTRFESLGLLLPEAILILGALVWARTRNA